MKNEEIITTQFLRDFLLTLFFSCAPSNKLIVFIASSSFMKRIKSTK